MKALIGTTCIAILAAVGYFFWGEYQAAADAKLRADAVEAVRQLRAEADRKAREEIFRLAYAEPGEEDMASGWCKLTAMRAEDGRLKGNAEAERIVQNCKRLGLLD